MSIDDEIRQAIEVEAKIYVNVARAVLSERDHIDTGLLFRTLRVEGNGRKFAFITQFYGPILDARSEEIQKVPPGPLPVGWLEETRRIAGPLFARNVEQRLAPILAREIAKQLNRS